MKKILYLLSIISLVLSISMTLVSCLPDEEEHKDVVSSAILAVKGNPNYKRSASYSAQVSNDESKTDSEGEEIAFYSKSEENVNFKRESEFHYEQTSKDDDSLYSSESTIEEYFDGTFLYITSKTEDQIEQKFITGCTYDDVMTFTSFGDFGEELVNSIDDDMLEEYEGEEYTYFAVIKDKFTAYRLACMLDVTFSNSTVEPEGVKVSLLIGSDDALTNVKIEVVFKDKAIEYDKHELIMQLSYEITEFPTEQLDKSEYKEIGGFEHLVKARAYFNELVDNPEGHFKCTDKTTVRISDDFQYNQTKDNNFLYSFKDNSVFYDNLITETENDLKYNSFERYLNGNIEKVEGHSLETERISDFEAYENFLALVIPLYVSFDDISKYTKINENQLTIDLYSFRYMKAIQDELDDSITISTLNITYTIRTNANKTEITRTYDLVGVEKDSKLVVFTTIINQYEL